MARPARSQWVPRAYARRRHRTWMTSMICASLGWGCWWLHFTMLRFAPEALHSRAPAAALAACFGGAGLLLAIWTLRARRSWLLFVGVALLANASLLALPWIIEG